MKTKHLKKIFGAVLMFLFCAAFELYAGGGGGGGGFGGGGGGAGGGGARWWRRRWRRHRRFWRRRRWWWRWWRRWPAAAAQAPANTINNGVVGTAQIYMDPNTHKIMVVADEKTAKQIQDVLNRLDDPAAAGAHPGRLRGSGRQQSV